MRIKRKFQQTRRERKDNRWGFLFSLPCILGFVIFALAPMVISLVLSFMNYNFTTGGEFVGLANYKRLFGGEDPYFFTVEVFMMPPRWIPSKFMWQNYKEVFDTLPFTTYFKNSFIITGGCVLGTMLTSSICAYGLSRIKWRGRNIVFACIISSMMLPFCCNAYSYIFDVEKHWNYGQFYSINCSSLVRRRCFLYFSFASVLYGNSKRF